MQAGTVLSGEHRRQTGSDGQKLRETSKTRDPGHLTSSRCQLYKTLQGLRMPGQNHRADEPRVSNGPELLQETWETGRSGAILACSHAHHTAGKSE